MNIAERLRTKIRNSADLTPQVKGLWRPIQMCLDDNAGEFLNVGVVFSYGGKTQVRMMDSFERLRCLYGRRVDTNELKHLLQDVAETIIQCQAELPDDLSENIRLGAPLYAAGLSPEAVLDSLFKDVVAVAHSDDVEPAVSGCWFPIRLVPDLVAGELFNVGVGFQDAQGTVHVRLIRSMQPFTCLYGEDAANNLGFLLEITREHFSRPGVGLITPSPHIRLGDQRYASGNSVDEILDDMYAVMVPPRLRSAAN